MKALSASSTHHSLVDLQVMGAGYYHTMVLFDAGLKGVEEYLNPGKEGDSKGPVDIEWYSVKDDHTLRTCLSVPMPQGEA
jgi:hypothetical protein